MGGKLRRPRHRRPVVPAAGPADVGDRRLTPGWGGSPDSCWPRAAAAGTACPRHWPGSMTVPLRRAALADPARRRSRPGGRRPRAPPPSGYAPPSHSGRHAAGRNALWDSGMGSSLRAGLAALDGAADVDAALVLLVDTPGITAASGRPGGPRRRPVRCRAPCSPPPTAAGRGTRCCSAGSAGPGSPAPPPAIPGRSATYGHTPPNYASSRATTSPTVPAPTSTAPAAPPQPHDPGISRATAA